MRHRLGSSLPRVLVIAPFSGATGLGRIARGIARSLDDADVHVLSLDAGDVEPASLPPRPLTIHPNTTPADPFARDDAASLTRELNPDVVLIAHAVWPLGRLARAARSEQPDVPVVGYLPLDGRINEPAAFSHLGDLHTLVACTRFGATELERACVRTHVPVIPHAIDDRFKPLVPPPGPMDSRSAARAELWKGRSDLANAFIFLNANKNDGRKRIDITLQAFAELLRRTGAEDAWLSLHMGTGDSGTELVDLIYRLGISERVLLRGVRHPSDTDGRLNLHYNACEVGVNTSMGEGWGLVAFEHAATGAAQVISRNPVAEELWDGGARLVPTRPTPPVEALELMEADPFDVAAEMIALYSDQGLLARMSEIARQTARCPEWTWDAVGRKWRALVAQIVDDVAT